MLNSLQPKLTQILTSESSISQTSDATNQYVLGTDYRARKKVYRFDAESQSVLHVERKWIALHITIPGWVLVYTIHLYWSTLTMK